MSTLSVSLEFLTKAINGHNFQAATRPFVIGISGPQGSGKSYLTLNLVANLQKLYPSLNIVQFLMDDLYLSHKNQEELSRQARTEDNPLLQGRGLPGTHDVELGLEIFRHLTGSREAGMVSNTPKESPAIYLSNKSLQESVDPDFHGSPLKIPVYDKSAFCGEGDREPFSKWQSVKFPVDLVIFEGWFNGFLPLDSDQLRTKFLVSGPEGPLQRYRMSSLEAINSKLQQYTQFWAYFDKFVFLQTTTVDNVYSWRLEQEHDLLVREGRGMTDNQVSDFVRRYMPVYQLYYDKMCKQGVVEKKDGNLRIEIDKSRNVIGSTIF